MDPYGLNRPLGARTTPQEPAILTPDRIMDEISWSEGDWIRSMIAYGNNPDPVVRKKGIQIYQEMMEDDQIKACIEIRKQSRLSTPWNMVSADEQSTEANMYRDYIQHVLDRMDGTFEDDLYDIYSAIENGFSISELIFELLPDGPFEGKMGLRAIKTRDPLHYDFKTDIYGNLQGIVYSGVGANLLPASGGSQPKFVPMPGQSLSSGFGNFNNPFPKDKFIIYSYNAQFGNWYGRSDLLAAFRSWISKKHAMKFWNIWLERYASPFPVITVDPDQIQKKGVMNELDNFIKNLSAKAGIRVPKGVTIDIKEGQAARSAVYTEAISTHNRLMSHAILVPNLLGFSGEQGGKAGGSYALGQKQFDAFFWVLDKMGRDTAEDIVGEQIIKRLINLSFPDVPPKLIPRFKYEEINEDSITSRSTIVDILAKGGFINTQEPWIREFLTIPKGDPKFPPVQPVAPGSVYNPTADKNNSDPSKSPDQKGNRPNDASAEPNKPGDTKNLSKFTERTPNKFEQKIQVKEFEKKINALESSFYIAIENEMSKIMQKMVSWVDKKNVISDGNPKIVQEIPLNVSSLKDTLKAWLIKIHLDSKLRLLEEIGRSGVNVQITKKFEDAQVSSFEPWDPLPPTEAITFFNKKVNASIINTAGEKVLLTLALRQELSYYDTKAFSISGVIRDDILNSAKAVLLNAIKRNDLSGGIKDLKDVFTKYVDQGLMQDGELLTPGRLFTIVRTNMAEAINEGRRAMMEDPDVKDYIQYWLYSAIIDDRTTDYCQCMDGLNFRSEDLGLLNPPAHFNCRSISVPITKSEVDRDGVEVSDPCFGRMIGFKDIKRDPIQIIDTKAPLPPKPIDVAVAEPNVDLPPTPRSEADIASEKRLREELSQLITRCPYTDCWSDKIHIVGGKLNIAEFVCDKCTMPFRVSAKGDLYLYDAGVEKWERTTVGLMPSYFKEKIKYKSFFVGDDPSKINPSDKSFIPFCPYTTCKSSDVDVSSQRQNLTEFLCNKCKVPFRITNTGDIYLFDTGEESWVRSTRGLKPSYFEKGKNNA